MGVPLPPPSIVDRLGWVLVHSFWQFAFLAFVAMLLQHAMRRGSATLRYATGVGAFGLMFLSVVATWFWLPTHPTYVPGEALAARTAGDFSGRSRANDGREASLTEVAPDLEAAGLGSSARLTGADEVFEVASATGLAWWWTSAEEAVRPWLRTVVLAWGAGVLAFGLRLLASAYMTHRLGSVGIQDVPGHVQAVLDRLLGRLGLRRAVRMLASTLVRAPAVVGLLRPAILLPAGMITGLPIAQLEALVAHELAHIRRHDYLVNLAQTALETLFFYHPAVWWLSHRIRQERENCCDDWAVALLGNRMNYCRAILAAAEFRHAQASLALSARGGSLVTRLRRVLEGEPRGRPGRVTRIAGAGTGVVGVLAMAIIVVMGLAASMSMLAWPTAWTSLDIPFHCWGPP